LLSIVGRRVQAVEWLFLAAAAPLLLFPSQYTLVGAGLIAATWLTRRVATGRWSVPSAAHWPAALLVFALLLSLCRQCVSIQRPQVLEPAARTWPPFTPASTEPDGHSPALGCPIGSVFASVLALVGLFGMGEPADKGFIAFSPFTLPHIDGWFSRRRSRSMGFPANEVAGS